MSLWPCYVLWGGGDVLVNIETVVSVTTHVTIKRDEIGHKQTNGAILAQLIITHYFKVQNQ